MKSIRGIFLLSILALSSCISNDLPYPVIVPQVKSVIVPSASSVDIDQTARTIKASFPEQTDIRSVDVNGIEIDAEPLVCTPELKGTFDLSSPLEFTLRTYQDYVWKLIGIQNIERYFSLKGQVGKSVIDVENHRVVARVSRDWPLSRLKVLSFKLGAADVSSYSVDMLSRENFLEPVDVDVTAHGRTERWTVFVEHADVTVEITSLDAWTRVAWAYASGISGKQMGFRFRELPDGEWKDVPESGIVVQGGDFHACLDGLKPETDYECVAVCGSDESEASSFRTGREQQLPNAGMEVYSHAESENYNSWFDPSHVLWSKKWWDSGNTGSTMVGPSASICNPDTSDKAEGACSARLNSRYVVIKFAAGNLFCGEFAGLVGLSGGMVDFGRPFTERPRKMTLSLKYRCGVIDCVNSYPEGHPVSVGDTDRAQVFVALGDWDYRKFGGTKECPVRVNTTSKATFFNPESDSVIAYGSVILDKSVDSWTRVEIPLDYRSTSRMPSHIIVSCAASMLGDYFTGSSSSVLWVDDFNLEY